LELRRKAVCQEQVGFVKQLEAQLKILGARRFDRLDMELMETALEATDNTVGCRAAQLGAVNK
jgi:hypothetical protein